MLSTIGVKECNSHKFSSAIDALPHVYSRWESGPAIGLSVGYAGNKLKKLNTANLNTSNTFITETDTEIKYDDVYKGSFFIGLTYNLSKK